MRETRFSVTARTQMTREPSESCLVRSMAPLEKPEEEDGKMATTEGAPVKSSAAAETQADAWYSLAPAEVTGRLGVDPAVVSAPMITTLVDGTGLFIYFEIARYVLQLG